MIITKKVFATVSGRNKSHYEKMGYNLPYQKDNRGRIGVPKGAQIEVDVLDIHPSSQIRIQYECDDCGCISEVPAQSIFWRKNSQYNKTGETVCSSCANKRMSGENSGNYKHGNVRYPEYASNARRRNIEFMLSIEEFEEIINQECYYCGGFSVDRNPKSRGQGIDRKDSNRGYEYSNCVPCCATCNFVKNSMPHNTFIQYIRDLYAKTKDYEI